MLRKNESILLSFHHALIHEFIAAIYVCKEVEKDVRFLEEAFPDWQTIKQLEEVCSFSAGLIKDELKSHFVEYLCNVTLRHGLMVRLENNPNTSQLGIFKGDLFEYNDRKYSTEADVLTIKHTWLEIHRECMQYPHTRATPFFNRVVRVLPLKHELPENCQIPKAMMIALMDIEELYINKIVELCRLESESGPPMCRQTLDLPEDQQLLVFHSSTKSLGYVNRIASSVEKLGHIYIDTCTHVDNNDQMDAETASSEGAVEVSKMFRKDIKSLFLVSCQFSTPIWKQIADAIRGSETLTVVRIRNTTNIPNDFLKTLTEIENLKYISLQNCELSEEGSAIICSNMARCFTKVEKFDISWNKIGDSNGDLIADAIENWNPTTGNHLAWLYLNDCDLTSETMSRLLKVVAKCAQSLERLRISGNNLSGCVKEIISNPLGFSKLKGLWLHNSSLNEDDIENLPKILHLPQIEVLDVGGNKLKQHQVAPIIKAANQQGRSMTLQLSGNDLSENFKHGQRSQSRRGLKLLM